MKKIGFLSFGHWAPSPQSQTQSATDALLQSVDLAVEAERLGSCVLGLNLPDLEFAVGPRCSPVHLLATPLASLLSTHRDLWCSHI